MELPGSDLSIGEFEFNEYETGGSLSSFLEIDEHESLTECSSQEDADYGNGMFLKLRDCGISVTAANTEFG